MIAQRPSILTILVLLTCLSLASCKVPGGFTGSLTKGSGQTVSLGNLALSRGDAADDVTIYPQTYTHASYAALSADGKYLATCSQNNLQLWDLDARVLVRNVPLSGSTGGEIRFLESGKEVLVISSQSGVPWQFVDIETGRVRDGLWSGSYLYVKNVSPDGSIVGMSLGKGQGFVRVSDGSILHKWEDAEVLDAFSERLAMISYGRTLALVNPVTGQRLGSFPTGSYIRSGRFSPDGRQFVYKATYKKKERLEAVLVRSMQRQWVRTLKEDLSEWGFTRSGAIQTIEWINGKTSLSLRAADTGELLYRDEGWVTLIHDTAGHYIRSQENQTDLVLDTMYRDMSAIHIPSVRPSGRLLGVSNGVVQTGRYKWDGRTGLPVASTTIAKNAEFPLFMSSSVTPQGVLYGIQSIYGGKSVHHLMQYDLRSGTKQLLRNLGDAGGVSATSDHRYLAAVEQIYGQDTPEVYLYTLPDTTPAILKVKSETTNVKFATDDECLVVLASHDYKNRLAGYAASDHKKLFEVRFKQGEHVWDYATAGDRKSGYKILVSLAMHDSGSKGSLGLIDSKTKKYVWRSPFVDRDHTMAILGFVNNETQFLLARGSVVELRQVMTGQLVTTYDVAVSNLWTRWFEDPASGHAYVTGQDGAIYVLDVKRGTMVGNFYEFEEGEWLSLLSTGYYAASEKGAELMNVRVGNKVHSIGQFAETFYRPDVVATAHAHGLSAPSDESAVADAAGDAGQPADFAAVARQSDPPYVTLVAPTAASTGKATIKAVIELEDTGGGIGKVVWKLNGITLGVETEGRGIVVQGKERERTRATREFSLVPGLNEIEVLAYDMTQKVASAPARLQIEYTGTKRYKPRLFILAVGVDKYKDRDLWLNYSVADAKSVSTSFEQRAGSLYDSVSISTLFDDQVTQKGLEAKFAKLTKSIKASDVFVFYAAGHGVTMNGGYYLIPHDFRYTSKTSVLKGGIGQDFLQRNLAKIPAMKSIVLLDTCNSGTFTLSRPGARGMATKAAIDRLVKATGRATIVASKGDQVAYEGYKGHGVFTWVVLQGLSEADRNSDKVVSIFELATYISEKLPDLTDQAFGYEQVPQVLLQGEDFPFLER